MKGTGVGRFCCLKYIGRPTNKAIRLYAGAKVVGDLFLVVRRRQHTARLDAYSGLGSYRNRYRKSLLCRHCKIVNITLIFILYVHPGQSLRSEPCRPEASVTLNLPTRRTRFCSGPFAAPCCSPVLAAPLLPPSDGLRLVPAGERCKESPPPCAADVLLEGTAGAC